MTTQLLPLTERTNVRRLRDRQVRDRAALTALLDDGLIAHVAVCRDGAPVVLPMAYAHDGDRLLLHGSTGAGLFRAAAHGTPVSVAVTHLDGLVFARSVFDSSMNYRSAVVFGTAHALEGAEKLAALKAITEHLMPGRWDEVRPPTRRELAATVVLAVPLDEVSVKVRSGGPSEGGSADGHGDGWAGVLPLSLHTGDPVPAADVPAGTPTPRSVAVARGRRDRRPLRFTERALAALGEGIAEHGLTHHAAEVALVSGAARAIAPAAAQVLVDANAPTAARLRAFAVVARALSRDGDRGTPAVTPPASAVAVAVAAR